MRSGTVTGSGCTAPKSVSQVHPRAIISSFDKTSSSLALHGNTPSSLLIAATEALSQQLHFDALRGFEMMIYDRQEREMFTFRRPVRCDTCCCPSFMQEMHIFSRHCGEDRLVCSVTQVWSLFAARFILDAGREDARLIVRSTPFICSQFMDIAFEITDRSERVVGGIQKLRVPRDARRVNDKNLYAIAFPVEIDVEMKAVCMGALFLINFLYNEDMPKRNLVKSRRQLKQVDSDSDESDEQSA